MSKLILHIGLHKTGTSAIQRALHGNRELLCQRGIFYPPTGEFEAHHAVASRLKQSASDDEATGDIERTFGHWRRAKYSKVIVSSEIFSECRYLGALGSLRKLFDEIEIVIYIRRQDLLLESAYGQLIKQNGETREIESSSPYFVDIYRHVKKFVDVISPDLVTIRKYQKNEMLEQDAAKDFFGKVIGLDDLERYKFDLPVNKSLSLIGSELVRHVNGYNIVKRERLISDVISACERLGGKFSIPLVGNLFHVDKRKQILDGALDSNDKLWSEFNLKFEKFSTETMRSNFLDSFSASDALCLAAEMCSKEYIS